MEADSKIIRVKRDTKDRMERAKVHPRQSYDEVINDWANKGDKK